MKLKQSRSQQAARIELLPLIDVIFLLLIFFIFIMLKMTMQSSIKVDLPALTERQQQAQKMLTISIDAQSQIFVNGQQSTKDNFLERVISLQQASKSAILIRGDQHSDLGLALTILNRLRSAGFKHVSFAAQEYKGG